VSPVLVLQRISHIRHIQYQTGTTTRSAKAIAHVIADSKVAYWSRHRWRHRCYPAGRVQVRLTGSHCNR